MNMEINTIINDYQILSSCNPDNNHNKKSFIYIVQHTGTLQKYVMKLILKYNAYRFSLLDEYTFYRDWYQSYGFESTSDGKENCLFPRFNIPIAYDYRNILCDNQLYEYIILE